MKGVTGREGGMGDLFGDGDSGGGRNGRAPKPRKSGRLEESVAATPEDLAAGHRKRLRARFMGGGLSAVADYELLELVLFRAIPRRDVKPLAKRLIARFGGFAGALSAEPARLREIDGLGEAAILEFKIVEAAAQSLARGRSLGQPVLTAWDAVLEHCRTTMGHGAVEEFRVLFLDRKNRLIADEAQGRGTVDQVAVYPREVVKRALELNASALIVAHNHPSGDPTPSKADIEMTDRLAEAAEAVGLVLHDHVIIGAEKTVSFRGERLL
ncbi:MAG: DNA repair protein RadC [Pseudomonadota bacterium]